MEVAAARHHNVTSWIKENERFFKPPVCNKLMHNTQLKVFYVGGPNVRKDYHLEEGEELFYMHKGCMCLKVFVNNKFQDVVINEGEIFLLPARICHSPQRDTDTIGLVIERERLLEEQDCVRYYVDGLSNTLFERWFYCMDLGTQLVPIIQDFFNSEQYRTGKPDPEAISRNPAYEADVNRKLELPINLWHWLRSNKAEIHETGWKRLYGTDYETDVIVYGKGNHVGFNDEAETFCWQLEGSSSVLVDSTDYILDGKNETVLIPKGKRYNIKGEEDSLVMAVTMDHRNKNRVKTS